MAKRLFACIAALGIATSAIACGDGQDDPGAPGSSNKTNGGENGGVALGPDGQPIGPDGQPLPLKVDGIYELSNRFDLTTAGVFPDVANDTLKALSGFRESPSKVILDLAAVAGVPVVTNLVSIVPGPVKDFVLGYIDQAVFGALYEKYPVTKTLTGILDDLASITTQFELVTKLDLPAPDEAGDTPAHHIVSGVGYDWSEKHHIIRAPEIIATLTDQEVEGNAVSLEKKGPDLESARLRLGDHTFKIPVGSFALVAADILVKDKFGAANLRDAFGRVISCSAIADVVSKRCIGPACVGHKPEVEQVCSVGLDLLVGTLKANIRKLDLPIVRLQEGNASMWDAAKKGGPIDATIDRIESGYWTAAILVQGEEKTVLSSFTGKRIGETQFPSR